MAVKFTKSQLEQLTSNLPKDRIPEGTILLGFRGSITHGTYVDPENFRAVSDVDFQGIAIGPLDTYFGLKPTFEQLTFTTRDWDICVYEIRKMFSLW